MKAILNLSIIIFALCNIFIAILVTFYLFDLDRKFNSNLCQYQHYIILSVIDILSFTIIIYLHHKIEKKQIQENLEKYLK